ncbi:MAG: DoxX family protein, partial [Chitinophagaceae bacterium]
PIMVGIILHNAMYAPEGLAIAGVFLVINLWIIADNWNKYKPMVN